MVRTTNVKESLRDRRRALRIKLENFVCRTESGYRAYLRFKHGVSTPKSRPVAPWQNTTLKSRSEVEQAWAQVRELGVVGHGDLPKNWDALAALAVILEHTDPSSAVLDAGSEYYSPLLPGLSQYGYHNLVGINLAFDRVVYRGPIRYEPGDLTRTRFESFSFDAIACLSVIEHGVDLEGYFKEMSRILKPGGILVTSTDYWPQPLETSSASVYGCPVKIFTEGEISAALELAEQNGFELTGPVDLGVHEKAVRWERVGLDFTYVIFCLQKRV
jgi:SAM-dependent methyltransferase